MGDLELRRGVIICRPAGSYERQRNFRCWNLTPQAGKPAGIVVRSNTNAIVRSGLSYINLSKNTIPHLRRSGRPRAGCCRTTCGGSSRTTSNAAGLNPVFFVCGETPVTPNAWWRSVANVADMRSTGRSRLPMP